MSPAVRLRPITEADRPFLYRVYASTRQEELARTGWSEVEKQAFLNMQFEAQRRHYNQFFPDAEFQVIEIDGRAAGRLYLDRRVDEIRVVDIALLPEYRGLGVGGSLMRDILAEGTEKGLLVRIHVERENPAMRLYKRLGFAKIEEQGVYDLMEWAPPGQPTS